MKKQSAYTKKLIKNGVALFASGLVLIAATFAWFAINADSDVGNLSVSFHGVQYSIEYYRGTIVDDNYDTFVGLSDVSSVANDYVSPRRNNQKFTWALTSSLTVDSLYPGEYEPFRIDVTAGSGKTFDFVLQNITCTPPSGTTLTAADVYACISVNLVAVDSSGNVLTSTSGTLQQFASAANATGHISGLALSFTDAGTISVYMDVGMVGTQETLRATGASVSIGSVTIVDTTST